MQISLLAVSLVAEATKVVKEKESNVAADMMMVVVVANGLATFMMTSLTKELRYLKPYVFSPTTAV